MKKKPFYKKAWFWVLVVVVVGLAGGGGGNSDSSDAESKQETDTLSEANVQKSEVQKVEEVPQETKESDGTSVDANLEDAAEEIVYTTYTVTQMQNDLEANALKAESTYNNQYVEITGKLGTIDSSGAYISLLPLEDEWAIMGIQCYIMNEEQKAKVMEMAAGDTVTLRGKITAVGELMGYSLDIDSID